MATKLALCATVFTMTLLPNVVLAQEFEGTIKQRSVQVNLEFLQDLLWNDEAEQEYSDEAQYYAAQASKLFDLPMQRFESMAARGEADITQSTVHVKGSRVRIAGGSGEEAYMVYDLETGTFRLVNPQESTYLEYSRADMEEQQRRTQRMMAQLGVDMEEMESEMDVESDRGRSPKALDRSEVINGFRTTGYEVEAHGQFGRGWCAEDDSKLVQSLEALAAQAASLEEEEESDVEDLLCAGQLPIRVHRFDPSVGDYGIEEIVAIDRIPVPDESFAIPPGYKRISMQEMWR